MITSLSWLKNHLSTKANLNKIAERLTEIGLEVENIKSSNENLDNFIVCKIVKAQQHPNADKLKLCEVSLGNNETVKVVTGNGIASLGPFAQYIKDLSINVPVLYGMLSILLALILGVGAAILRRFFSNLRKNMKVVKSK